MRRWKVSEDLQRKLKRLSRKDKSLYDQVLKKIEEVVKSWDIGHYKNLRYNMKDSKRVHVGHFVLVFQFDKKNDVVNFDDLDHHDNVYPNFDSY